jgi:hypothetical protein
MSEIMRKMCQIGGMMEMLARLEGCTITPQMASLLIDACEMLEGVTQELTKILPDR